jgi:hypothetical protein
VFGRRRREDAERPGDAGISEQDAELGDEELDGDELADEYEDGEYEDDEPGEAEGEDAGVERAAAPAARGSGPAAEDLGDPLTWTRLRDPAAAAPRHGHRADGPWDAAAGYPDADRMGFGSLLVPAREGFDIHIPMDGESGIIVVYGESALELQAFAAPKRSGLWDEVRQEIAAEVAGNGGRSEEADGPFGPELLARVTPPPDQGSQQPQSLRFLGADGPRWFLRGLLTGPAAQRPELARPFEEIFADVVVVRGEHAEPPRKALDISLPEEARQFIEQQAEAEGMPNPFERGPEITEIR